MCGTAISFITKGTKACMNGNNIDQNWESARPTSVFLKVQSQRA